MYALQEAHRAGPVGPGSTSGIGSSRGSWSANGWIIAATGTSHSDARREVLGTFHVDMRTYLGDEFPGKAHVCAVVQSGSVKGGGRTLVYGYEVRGGQRWVLSRQGHVRLILPFLSVGLDSVNWRRYLVGVYSRT